MGKLYDEIDEKLAEFVGAQPMFFVATAPLDAGGHVNLSPKGLDTFAVLGPREVAWLDLVGSGAETIAHLRENGRITLMFCAFEGPPKIVRFYGEGEVLAPDSDGYRSLIGRFEPRRGPRSIVRVDVQRIADSCGYGVPLMKLEGPRDQLDFWAERHGPETLREYQRTKNARSIDGLDAVDWLAP